MFYTISSLIVTESEDLLGQELLSATIKYDALFLTKKLFLDYIKLSVDDNAVNVLHIQKQTKL